MRIFSIGLAFAMATSASFAQIDTSELEVIESEQANFQISSLVENLENPWSMAFLPDGDMLISERPGRLRYLDDGELRETPISGLPDNMFTENRGGLFGLALHPDFADNRWLYFAFTEGEMSANHVALARARLSTDGTNLDDLEVLFRVNFEKDRGYHHGGRIIFRDDGTLMLTIGEGSIFKEESQNPRNHMGTIIRLNDDGTVPFDNPFVSTRNVMPEIYSYGHRNPQGMDINPATGSVWAHEHGPRGGDEINIIEAGLNYGWPAVTYGIDYDGTLISEHRTGEGFTQPIWYWVPSIAPSGMSFYQGNAFPEWQGDLFIGALAGSMLVRHEILGDRVISEERLLEDLGIRIREVQTGPDGMIYLLTDDFEGQMLRIEPASE